MPDVDPREDYLRRRLGQLEAQAQEAQESGAAKELLDQLAHSISLISDALVINYKETTSMSSPNQYVTPEDKAKGYPFVIHCHFPAGKKVNSKMFHKALSAHGIEELSEIILQATMSPSRETHVAVWGPGRATFTSSGLGGWAEMPVHNIPEFIKSTNSKQKEA
jgi:hypothetical protein